MIVVDQISNSPTRRQKQTRGCFLKSNYLYPFLQSEATITQEEAEDADSEQMAGKEKSSFKKPMSLNDSHYRILQDLSAPPKTNPSHEEEEYLGTRPNRRSSKEIDEDDPIINFSGIVDFDSSPGEKPQKVKIEGRRRLCKMSARDEKEDVVSVPRFSDITDFDSPPPGKPSTKSQNEIRDILDDLSSRLDILSIEKKRVPVRRDPADDEPLGKDEKPIKEDKVNFSGYGVPGLSASLSTAVRSAVHFDDLDDDSDDCVIVSRKRTAKEAPRSHIEGEDDPSPVGSIEEFTDESFSGDGSIVLDGPKSSFKLPAKIATMLYPHQREGLKWLWALHCQRKGGILGDDMGLGKTMQICGFLAGLFHSKLIKRALVVAPKTLLSHWIKELSAVGLSEKTREYFGTCAKARQYELQYVLQDKGILLTTYDIVRNNFTSLKGGNYVGDDSDEEDMTWDYMILDEGHLIKNPSTQRAKSLLEIPSSYRIIISGTPIQNNLKELWALFNFCCPELLGDNKWFKDKYENPILRGNDKHATDRDKRIGSTVAKELREKIQPYFLRRLKNEVFREEDTTTAKLSKKNEIIVWLKLTACQRQLYEAFLKSEIVLSAFDGSPLAALTILKKICDHPLLLTKRAAEDVLEGMDSMMKPEDICIAEKLAMHVADVSGTDNFRENHNGLSCKIIFILSLLGDLIPKGHRVLIFSQTRKMLNLIQESLVSNGYTFLRIDGTTKVSDRMKIVNDFQEGIGAPIFLLTSQVGGLGLTLTKADRVIVVDPAWNPSTDNQSVDRAYRIGQKKDVVVYRLMTSGTVEEKIYRKQIFKGGLFKMATEHKEQIRYFSHQDLRELFSLPKQGFDISLTQQQLHEEHDHQHKMDENLEAHVKFLETLGIAGVSQHSLLFSKTAPVQVVQEEKDTRWKGASVIGHYPSSSSLPETVDGAEYAFNPKDVKLTKNASPSSETGHKLADESEIKERINRLSRIFANKDTVSRLPDKGAKLEKQIVELNAELEVLRTAKSAAQETINLDDMTAKLERTLNV